MIKDNKRFETVPCEGGLDLESTPLALQAGALIRCQNYEVKAGGGYSRIAGYERFNGLPSPTDSEDTEAARSAITGIGGYGPIHGLHYFNGALYAFRGTSDGLTSTMYKSTPTGWQSVRAGLQNWGKYEFVTHNFYGSSSSAKMFGVDGQNYAFMYDGTTYTSLQPTGETSRPKHIAAHRNHLFLSYEEGQYLHSGVGEPNAWDVATEGAGTGGMGDEIVGMKPTVGGALAFFCRNSISTLYGTSKADWQAADIRKQQDQSGAIEHSIQDFGDLFYLDDRGITTLKQTQAFGNFLTATIDRPVRRFIQSRKSKLIGSYISRERSQYVMLFQKGETETEALTLTMGSEGLDGYGVTLYPFVVTAVTSQEDETGKERIFASDWDGNVFELNKGTSFDGADIEAYIKLSFSHLRSPNQNKHFRQMILGLEAETNITLKLKPEFDYGSSEHAGHRAIDASLIGGGGAWDNADWNEFNFSAQVVSEAKVDIGGNGRNMAILIYHNGNEAEPFTIYNATIQYSFRGTRR